jgi:hypothetical protein
MANYDWPSSDLCPGNASLRVLHNSQAFTSPLSGYTQTGSLPGSRWGWSYQWAGMDRQRRARLEGFLARLSGRTHRVRLFDWNRQRPVGTINLTGVTANNPTIFSETLTLNGCGAGGTLEAGDWLGVGDQLVMCAQSAVASGGGVMTVEIRQMMRATTGGGVAVTLIRPTGLFVLAQSELEMPRDPGQGQPPMAAEFVEVFA